MDEKKDKGLQGNEKIEEAILALQQEPTEELLAHALTVVRRRMREQGQLIVAVEPPSADVQEAVTQAAVSGVGIANVGVHHAWKHLLSGQLKVLLLDWHHPGSFEMTLQYPHRALVAPRVRVTVDYLLESFARLEELHVPLTALRDYRA